MTILAIDGPAAAGKGTLAKRLAAHFGYDHLDTGALYRAVASRSLRTGETPEHAAERFAVGDLGAGDLRAEKVAQHASVVAAVPAVRAALLAFQRDFARRPPGGKGAVLDGRDIGTVVCPWPDTIKFFVTASLEARAKRRYEELIAKGESPIHAAVLAEMAERDARDAQRATAPLKPAPDAILLDTSGMTAEDVFHAALAAIAGKTR
ncbi:MAG: (d)CMP kinase [Azospirillum sp.]|nr:(d)CMP kinase [Azospirillum sp.]